MRSGVISPRWLPLVGPAVLLGVWALLVATKAVSPILLPGPGVTLQHLWTVTVGGSMAVDFGATLLRTGQAFAIATVIGVPLGVALGSSEPLYRSVEFLIDFFRSTPSSALIPLFMLFFGITDFNKVAIAAFAAVLVVMFNSAYGVMNAKRTRIMAAQVMGASRWQTFRDVLLWESLPQTFIGLRSGISLALVIVVVAEMFNAHMDDAVVGLMDPAHVPFVHNQWWWRPPSTGLRLKEKPFIPATRGWALARHKPSGNSLAYKMLMGDKVTTEIVFQIPGFRWEIVEAEKRRIFTLTCLTPVTLKKTRITQITFWQNAPFLDLALPILIPAARKFLGQDGHMVNLQNKGMAYQQNMLWIDDIDVQAKWYRILKKEWAASRSEGRPFANPIEPRTLRWRS